MKNLIAEIFIFLHYIWVEKILITKYNQKIYKVFTIKYLEPRIRDYSAYSARTAHPFRRNGAPFRFKLSKAQLVD